MKRYFLLVCLLAISGLFFRAIKTDNTNKAIIAASENKLLSYSGYKETSISKLGAEMEKRSGRQLTYFWAEHSDKPVKVQIKNI